MILNVNKTMINQLRPSIYLVNGTNQDTAPATSFNGMVRMNKTNHGWKVNLVTSSKFTVFMRNVVIRDGSQLILFGDFVRKPKCGFSVRPHKLFKWAQTGQASLEYLVTICAVLVIASNVFLPAYEYAVSKVYAPIKQVMGIAK